MKSNLVVRTSLTRGVALLATFLGTLFSSTLATAQVAHYVDNIDACKGRLPCYSTITDAVNAAAPSDSIRIFPGVYHESVSIGFGKDNLVLRAQAKAQPPVITSLVSIVGSHNVQVLHLILERGLLLGGGTSGALVEGNLISAGAIDLIHTSGVTVRNNTVLAVAGGLKVGIGLNVEVDACLVEGNTLSNASIISGSDSVISNVIRHNVIRGGGLHFDAGSFVSNTVEGNFVSGSPTDGIFIRVRRGGGGRRRSKGRHLSKWRGRRLLSRGKQAEQCLDHQWF